jgi:anti-sigma regulatory factor (Ser/Thr protein kinase)
LRLSVPAERDALEPARLDVNAFLARFALSARTLFGVELVLEETLMNIIEHAFGSGERPPIELSVRLRPGAVELRFEHGGVAFDPSRPRRLPRYGSREHAAVGGRGIVLMQRFAASIGYERNGDRNCLTIEVASPAAS